MTDWKDVSGADVSRETSERMARFVQLVGEENEVQNLVSRATIGDVWNRHIADSAQLRRFAEPGRRWLDIGSGAGLPGMVLAILSDDPITLCEPRRLRAAFLERVKQELGLAHVEVAQSKAERLDGKFDVITARAVAPATDLFLMTRDLTHGETIFLLMKGRTAKSELDEAARAWQGDFRLEPSVTSDDAAILVASGVKPRGAR